MADGVLRYRKEDTTCCHDAVQRTLTTRLMELPAASRMFFRPSQQAVVLSAMEPSTSLPEASAGIWPLTKIWGPAWIACDYIARASWSADRISQREANRGVQLWCECLLGRTAPVKSAERQ